LRLGSLAQLAHNFIDVAPGPAFTRLDRPDNRVLAAVKMFGSVFVLGGITATHVAALRAQSEMDPGIAGFDAIFADVGIGVCDFHRAEVSAV